MLLSETSWDNRLWWVMLVAGMAAALVSIGTGYVGRRQMVRITERQRLLLHLLSYVLLTLSMMAFILRGLSAPR
jgi:hypothetical protein